MTGLLGLAANLEAQGKDEYAEQGEIKGKQRAGKNTGCLWFPRKGRP